MDREKNSARPSPPVRLIALQGTAGSGHRTRPTRPWLRLTVLFMLASLCLGACGSHRRDAAAAVRNRSLEPIFSPNGEPLNGGPLGHPACNDAVSGWFARVDANHDGTLDLDEFLADARRQFAVMDLDKNGEITPDELSAYRAAFDASLSLTPAEEADAAPAAGGGKGRHRRGGATGSSGARAKIDVSGDTPDPVMSADVNLKFRVTLADFIAYERQAFTQLDLKRNGRVTLTEVQRSLCPAEANP